MTENFDYFDQKWMGIVMPVLTNEKRSMPRLLISVVFLLTWTKKEAQIAKTAAGYDLLREKKLMENKIAYIPNYLKRLCGFQFK